MFKDLSIYHWIKLFVVTLTTLLLVGSFEHFVENNKWELIRLNELALKDLDFNDIYYYNRKIGDDTIKSDVVLINIASKDPSKTIRMILPEVIENVDSFGAKVIGLDLYFEGSNDTETDDTLEKVLKEKKVVIGKVKDKESYFPRTDSIKLNFGCINFETENNQSIRYYRNFYENDTLVSLARKLATRYKSEMQISNTDTLFYLKYKTNGFGYFSAFEDFNPINFPCIEFKDLNDKSKQSTLQRLIKDKIVLIGWLNTNELDDIHRTPTDAQLINRLPKVPGIVIHANATQMLIDNTKMYDLEDDFIFNFISFISILLFLLFLEKIALIFKSKLIHIVVKFFFKSFVIFLIILFALFLFNNNIVLNSVKLIALLLLASEFKEIIFEILEYNKNKKNTYHES